MPGKKKEPTNSQLEDAGIGWDEFIALRSRKGTRDSRYADFISAMRRRTVYDASLHFPNVKSDTLRSALSGRAKQLGVKITATTRDNHLLVALAESE